MAAQKKIKGTQTEKNLLTSFAGESQARNRYTYFASQARKEGFVQISAIFSETADQEKEHAKRMFKFLQGGEVEIAACFPAGIIGTTAENLEAAAAGEHHEHTKMYPDFAKVAEKEGFKDVANMYRAVSVSEKRHEKRYLKLLANIKNNEVFKRPRKVTWVCRNCGYVHVGQTAPMLCPACLHPQAHYEIDSKNY
ncbi:MAG: rubrerythrin family protein [Sedimentisphaerales bacterium]|nr:rubrerythrin family protein [Sedimentisphaerales bacterium]